MVSNSSDKTNKLVSRALKLTNVFWKALNITVNKYGLINSRLINTV